MKNNEGRGEERGVIKRLIATQKNAFFLFFVLFFFVRKHTSDKNIEDQKQRKEKEKQRKKGKEESNSQKGYLATQNNEI